MLQWGLLCCGAGRRGLRDGAAARRAQDQPERHRPLCTQRCRVREPGGREAVPRAPHRQHHHPWGGNRHGVRSRWGHRWRPHWYLSPSYHSQQDQSTVMSLFILVFSLCSISGPEKVLIAATVKSWVDDWRWGFSTDGWQDWTESEGGKNQLSCLLL